MNNIDVDSRGHITAYRISGQQIGPNCGIAEDDRIRGKNRFRAARGVSVYLHLTMNQWGNLGIDYKISDVLGVCRSASFPSLSWLSY